MEPTSVMKAMILIGSPQWGHRSGKQAREQPDFEPVQREKIYPSDPGHGGKQLRTDGRNMKSRQCDERGPAQPQQSAP
jgi:hypothetical protein